MYKLSCFYSRDFSLSLPLWPRLGVMVLMLQHHTHETVLTEGLERQDRESREAGLSWLKSQRDTYISVFISMFQVSLTGSPGQRLVCLLMLVVQRKLICAGWTHLVQSLRSFYKLFIPDDPWVFCLHAGVTVLMPRHLHARYCSIRWLEARGL